MSSPRRRQDRPVVSVELKVSLTADGPTSKKIREAIPSAIAKRGGCEVRVRAEKPEEVAEKALEVLRKLRAIEASVRET